jgi:hypothetical protein
MYFLKIFLEAFMLSKKSSVILSAVFIALLTNTSHISLAGDKSLEAGSPSNKTKGDSSWIKEKTSSQTAAEKAREARMEEMRKSMAKSKEEVTAKDAEPSKPVAKVEDAKKPAEEAKAPPKAEASAKPSHKTTAPDSHMQRMKDQIARNKLKKQEELLKLQEANKAKKATDTAKPKTVVEHEKVTLKLPETALKVEQHSDVVITTHPDKVELKPKGDSADAEAKALADELHRNPALSKAMARSSGSHAPKASTEKATPNPEIVITHPTETLKTPEAAKKPLEMKTHPELEMKTHPDTVEKVTKLELPKSALEVKQHPETVEKVTKLELPKSALEVKQHPELVMETHPDKVEVKSKGTSADEEAKALADELHRNPAMKKAMEKSTESPSVGKEDSKSKPSLLDEIRKGRELRKTKPDSSPQTTPPAA